MKKIIFVIIVSLLLQIYFTIAQNIDIKPKIKREIVLNYNKFIDSFFSIESGNCRILKIDKYIYIVSTVNLIQPKYTDPPRTFVNILKLDDNLNVIKNTNTKVTNTFFDTLNLNNHNVTDIKIKDNKLYIYGQRAYREPLTFTVGNNFTYLPYRFIYDYDLNLLNIQTETVPEDTTEFLGSFYFSNRMIFHHDKKTYLVNKYGKYIPEINWYRRTNRIFEIQDDDNNFYFTNRFELTFPDFIQNRLDLGNQAIINKIDLDGNIYCHFQVKYDSQLKANVLIGKFDNFGRLLSYKALFWNNDSSNPVKSVPFYQNGIGVDNQGNFYMRNTYMVSGDKVRQQYLVKSSSDFNIIWEKPINAPYDLNNMSSKDTIVNFSSTKLSVDGKYVFLYGYRSTYLDKNLSGKAEYPFLSIYDTSGVLIKYNEWYSSDSNPDVKVTYPYDLYELDDNRILILCKTDQNSSYNSTSVLLELEIEKPNIVLENLNSFQFLEIYPNPTQTSLIVNTDEEIEYSVYNITGYLIKSGSTSELIDINDLENGLYFIEIIYKNNKFFKKFIKN